MSLQIFNDRQKAAIQSINRILTELPHPDVHATVAGMVVLGLDVLAGGISPEYARNFANDVINGPEQSPQPLVRDGRD